MTVGNDPDIVVIPDDRTFETVAVLDGATLTQHDIRSHEITRARRALAYLKDRIGDEAMRSLLADDIAQMMRTVRDWVDASQGRWRAASVTLKLPGPGAEHFKDWYAAVVDGHRGAAMRAGHPEHYLNTPGDNGIEVIEPIGETGLPWRIRYRTVDPESALPVPWATGFPVRFAAEIVDMDGVRVGYSLRALRGTADGMEMRLTTCLPEATPDETVARHLQHFAIEYRNWAVLASAELENSGRRRPE